MSSFFCKFRSKELAWKNIFVLDLHYSNYFFVYSCGNKKTKRLSKEEIKKQLL